VSSTGQFELEFEALLNALPAPVPVSSASGDPAHFDCLIGVCGFESRCTHVAQALRDKGVRCRQAIAIHYAGDDLREPNEAYAQDLHSALRAMCGSEVARLPYDDHDLGRNFGERLVASLMSHGAALDLPTTRIGFDITVGTSRLLLEGLHSLLHTSADVTLYYAEADEYRPTFSEYRSVALQAPYRQGTPPEFLSLGVDKVELLRSIPGRNVDARPAYLVVFPSFTPTRIGAVLDELSPSGVHWLFGVPHMVKNRWRMDAQREYHESLMDPAHRHCYVSTFDYRETLEVLEAVYRTRKNEYALFVCSLGSKMQKVGQVLFHILRPEVGAVVSIPRTWDPKLYSGRTVKTAYVLNLGDAASLRKRLSQTRTFRV
jgi:hypothetical protein